MKTLRTSRGMSYVKSAAITIALLGLLISSAAPHACAQVGWAVGSSDGTNGTILFTNNGGGTWTPQTTGVPDVDLNGVDSWDGKTAWAVGAAVGGSGTILRGSAVGMPPTFTWAPVAGAPNQNLNGVSFIDGSNGWAVGSGGTILYSNGGAGGWVQQRVGTTENLYGVYFVKQSFTTVIGCAVGANATVLIFTGKIKDGKVTGEWSAPQSLGRGDFRAVSGKNSYGEVKIYAVGDPRLGIWEWSNRRPRGEQPWQRFGSPSDDVTDLRAVQVVSTGPTNIWVGQAKKNANVENWNNTGKWINRSVTGDPPFKYVFGMAFVPGRLGPDFWVVGSRGHIGFWNGTSWTRQDTGTQTLSGIVMLPTKKNDVKLEGSTSPDGGSAGTSYLSLTGSGFPDGNINPANVVVELATDCQGPSSATTSAASIVSGSGNSKLVSFLLPGGLSPGKYFVGISDSWEGDASFESSNCSEVKVSQ